jgi:hypothetical protein
MLKIITAPLQEMCTSGVFKWERVHQEAFQSMKLLCSLKFTNSVIDQTKNLFIACDSSQIALGILAFQISDNGEIILIFTDSKILKQSDRNRASAFRELLALVYGVISLENEIRMYKMNVIMLTDAISLSLLHRQKYSNNRLLEISIYLSSFNNLSIHFVSGPQLFFADLISRQYNLVHLQNNQEKITKEWSELLPPAKIRNIGTVLSAEKLNDFLLTKQSNEYLDCFAGSSFYSQNTTRYFNLKAADLDNNNIPKEIMYEKINKVEKERERECRRREETNL